MKTKKISHSFLAAVAVIVLLLPAAVYFLAGRKPYTAQELVIQKGEKEIYGWLYRPRLSIGTYPLVILGHGYGGSYSDNLDYGRFFSSHGIACYVFDFCGGSKDSKSSGSMEEMSVYTEIEDLNDIMDHMQNQSWLQKDGLYLAGKSLGGCVAALTASQRPDEVAGLLLHYPFFVWSAALRGENAAESEVVPHVFEQIAAFHGPVLIFNGDKDTYVPLEYTEKAVDAYENARLHVMEGSGHGFRGEARDFVKKTMLEFIHQVT